MFINDAKRISNFDCTVVFCLSVVAGQKQSRVCSGTELETCYTDCNVGDLEQKRKSIKS